MPSQPFPYKIPYIYHIGFNWSSGNHLAADMAIQLSPGIWQGLKGRGVTLGWARWPHNCWNCKVLQNIHQQHCNCHWHHHHHQWPPEADVDDGVVRLAPHGGPLVVREVVHLGHHHSEVGDDDSWSLNSTDAYFHRFGIFPIIAKVIKLESQLSILYKCKRHIRAICKDGVDDGLGMTSSSDSEDPPMDIGWQWLWSLCRGERFLLLFGKVPIKAIIHIGPDHSFCKIIKVAELAFIIL